MVFIGQHSLYAFNINEVKDSDYYYNPSRFFVLIEWFVVWQGHNSAKGMFWISFGLSPHDPWSVTQCNQWGNTNISEIPSYNNSLYSVGS